MLYREAEIKRREWKKGRKFQILSLQRKTFWALICVTLYNQNPTFNQSSCLWVYEKQRREGERDRKGGKNWKEDLSFQVHVGNNGSHRGWRDETARITASVGTIARSGVWRYHGKVHLLWIIWTVTPLMLIGLRPVIAVSFIDTL